MAHNEKKGKRSPEELQSLDVEIGFLEGLARREKAWVEALKLLGDSYTRRGRIQDGLRVDERLAGLCPEDPEVHYNLACSLSLSHQFDEAFAALDRAFKLGYSDLDWLNKDPDLDDLRKHPLYKKYHGKADPSKSQAE
jgi:hypothetical protein